MKHIFQSLYFLINKQFFSLFSPLNVLCFQPLSLFTCTYLVLWVKMVTKMSRRVSRGCISHVNCQEQKVFWFWCEICFHKIHLEIKILNHFTKMPYIQIQSATILLRIWKMHHYERCEWILIKPCMWCTFCAHLFLGQTPVEKIFS